MSSKLGPDDPMTTDELREIVHLVTTKQPMPEGRRRRFQETFRSMKQQIADDRAAGCMTWIPSD